jgi:hypothetical protein
MRSDLWREEKMRDVYKKAHVLLLVVMLALAWLMVTACGIGQPVVEPAPTPTQDGESPAPTATVEAPTEEPAEPTPAPQEPAPTPPAEAGPVTVAFVEDGDIWLWEEATGESLQLTQGGGVEDVRLSGDGELVAFLRDGALWVVGREESGERQLVDEDDLLAATADGRQVAVHRFEWLPGSNSLLFNTRVVLQEPGFFLTDDLHRVDVGSGEVTMLLPGGEGGEFYPSLDGSQVAVVTPRQIGLMEMDSGSEPQVVLEFAQVATYSEFLYYPRPAWAPDGSELAVAIPPPDPFAQTGAGSTLWRIPADGSEAVIEGAIPATPFASEPAFSPDLSHIMYLGRAPGGATMFPLYVGEVGEEPQPYLEQAASLAGWALDSRHFAFFVSAGESSNALFLGTPGEEPQVLADTGATLVDLEWVDATRFLYLSGGSGTWELRLGTIEGQNEVVAEINGFPPPYHFTR